jgi:aspartyl-tRNA(Asn)/glutamyl-tRNA(Gln) amidotransferase subunit A
VTPDSAAEEFAELDALGLADAVRRGEVSARHLVERSLAAIDADNAALNAFVLLDPEGALRQAGSVDRAIARGHDPGLLAGLPFGVKDLEDCAGLPTTHGSLLFKDAPPAEADSIHVARLRAAGAIPVGKTAVPEFGMDSSTTSRAWGVTRNPRRLDSTPGGSSGGSAAAVAAGLVPLATGSDGGGSTRTPAAFCGLVGLKPTVGRIPKPSTSPSGLSCPSALVSTVRDCARHLDVACGPDTRDRWSIARPEVRFEDVIERLDVSGLRATWSADLGYAPVQTAVRDIAEAAADELFAVSSMRRTAAEVRGIDHAVDTWVRVVVIDLWSTLSNEVWPDGASQLAPELVQFLEDHPAPSFDQIRAAHEAREQIQQRTAELFEEVDVVLTPTVAVSGFAAEGPLPREVEGVATPFGPEVFTMWSNLTGQPAISVPAGIGSDGLPVGLQIVTPAFREDVLLRLARLLEIARPWPPPVILDPTSSKPSSTTSV